MEEIIKGIQSDTLAVIVFVMLLVCLVASIVLINRSKPIPMTKSKHIGFLPILAMLGLPAVIDLLRNDSGLRGYALIVLVVFILNIVIPLLNIFGKSNSAFIANWYTWSVPVLIIGGFVVAGYLYYVESASIAPICGVDIHGCETVQTSSYAKLFGFLPVAGLGLIGYLAILITWFAGQLKIVRTKIKVIPLFLWGLCAIGVAFSTYLTYLEPFVIHATCSWCISSAVLMMSLLWVSTPAAQHTLLEWLDE